MVITHLEEFINELYAMLRITEPKQLEIFDIAKKLGITVIYRKKNFKFDNEIILQPGTKQREWQKFGHELCHHLRHCGSQARMHPLFIDLQEYQATHFAYHFCVPSFMLKDIREPTTKLIMETFNVEQHFAERRLEMYKNKLLLEGRRNESSLIRI
ncbi:ImmA/IrrE family metallo-endopeptidase [Virgibacillus halodenitrificans]|uniref:ImmA/IrrE family metallo-endopeptidase n=2 Tax=Virgibacillus halodenitrificans TaxID=1482 RepID=A0ABR7VPR8_VIRHA|nr:ImmA/IrrE family metallo-endopeptidase [Virgibacillus halodenitrificans]